MTTRNGVFFDKFIRWRERLAREPKLSCAVAGVFARVQSTNSQITSISKKFSKSSI